MDGESSTPATTTTMPVNITKPAEDAPPTPADSATAPVAEMSGALQDNEKPPEAPTEPAMPSTNAPATNGVSDPTPQPTEEKPAESSEPAPITSEPKPSSEDTEMNDAAVAEPAGDGAAPESGDGLARKSSVSKRKSTGGVPEHKSKKLSKKKSMPKMTNIDAKPGEYYFARLKSYPPWPSMICDEEMLPSSLLATRPVTTKQEDGTYREAYADGGKKVNERTFPVMFLHTNEFAWMSNTDLTPLDPSECKDVAEKGKAKQLIAAYHVAAEGHDLQYFKDMLADHARALEEDQQLQEQKAAEKAAKAESKKKRKSSAAVVAEDDDVEMEDADDAEPKKASKKRKKEAETDDEEKPAKTPKTTKLKINTPKAPPTEKKTKDSAKAAKAKSEKKKSKPTTDDEEMVDSEEKEPEKPVDPVEERKAREKEVLFLRHKLQKGFLSRDQAPQEDEMPQMANYIKKLENYGELDVGIIRTTKINKVLKALIKLNTIPKDEEFNFRSRSMDLLNKWNRILGTDNADDSAPAEKDSEPATNGVHKDETAEKPKSTEPTPTPVAQPADAAVSESQAEVKPAVEAEKSAPAVPAETDASHVASTMPESAAEPAPVVVVESTEVTLES